MKKQIPISNAVNGVINLISKSAKDTQGSVLNGGGGKEERGFGSLRYGGWLGTNAYYRAYAICTHHLSLKVSLSFSAVSCRLGT